MRGIIIAGTHSGCGKTTVTIGILAALRQKGLAVRSFKTGPDFIDAGLHRLVLNRPSRNLDQWMCGPDYVADCFNRHSANTDISVIEGVMGMYDGDYSTAELARLLRVPVLLVVDAYGMAESAGAVVYGFAEFGVRSSEFRVEGGKVNVAGVIFNRVASENHFRRLKDSVREVPVLGYLPREPAFEIPHRHLGLTVAEEHPLEDEIIEKLADTVLKYIDVDAIISKTELEREKEQGSFQQPSSTSRLRGSTGFKLAVACDKAFSFYYEDNLDLLRDAGAEIIFFSPLTDPAIPHEADAVYIGGGYPEMHAGALSRNASMLDSIRGWAETGKPMYTECGGLMYLSRGIRDLDDIFHAMAGVFPFETRMMKKPRLAYREIVLSGDCILGKSGEKCRGHEFHYSEIADGKIGDTSSARLIYSVRDKNGVAVQSEGFSIKNTLASYIHVHFGSNPRIAERFADFIKGEKRA